MLRINPSTEEPGSKPGSTSPGAARTGSASRAMLNPMSSLLAKVVRNLGGKLHAKIGTFFSMRPRTQDVARPLWSERLYRGVFIELDQSLGLELRRDAAQRVDEAANRERETTGKTEATLSPCGFWGQPLPKLAAASSLHPSAFIGCTGNRPFWCMITPRSRNWVNPYSNLR
jgi:hypothetical protein